MKQDQLNQHIKHALESIEPEVPAHLWSNVKAGISAGAPASGGAEAAQSAASSAGSVGSAAALKIGVAAIAVIGGGLLVWQLATDAPKETSPITQQVEQNVAPTNERAAENQPNTGGETIATVESEEVEKADSKEVPSAHSSVDEPITDAVVKDSDNHEQAVQEESAPNEDPSETKVAETPAMDANQEMTEDDSQSPSPAVVAEDRSSGNDEAGVVNEDEDHTATDAMEMDVPLEAGILADKVSGEAPLTVNFANVADAHSFEWDFDNGRRSVEHNPVMTFTEPGDYMVRLVVRDAKGNRVNDQMEITVFEVSKIFVPDVITPNGDGVNDEFRVIGHNVTQVHFSIYRLDGTMVFESRSMNDAWDGIDAQTPQADKYIVEAVAVKTNGKPIQKRQMLHVLRE